MLSKLKKNSEFSRNLVTLMSGTAVAQAIPIAISPILTRIYTPEDFGVFALYMSIASILSVMATARYELAIMLPRKDSDALNLLSLSIFISFFVSFVLLLLVYLFNNQITTLLGNREIAKWLYFIPLSVLLTGLYQTFNYWLNRKKEYKSLALTKVTQSTTAGAVNLSMGFVNYGASGLVVSSLAGQMIATSMLIRKAYKGNRKLLNSVKRLRVYALMRKYIDFPKINAPHAFLNEFSSNLPVFIINYFFLSVSTGLYALANRIILAPMSIVTSSYGQLFLQKMTHHYHTKNGEERFFKHTLYILMVYSFPFFLFLMIYAPQIFATIFGEAWMVSGKYVQILIPMLYFRFAGSVVSSVTLIYNEQKKAFSIEIINVILRILSLVVGGFLGSMIVALALFSFVSSLVTIYRLFWYLKIIKARNDI